MSFKLSVTKSRNALPDRPDSIYWQVVEKGFAIGIRKVDGVQFWHAKVFVGDGKYARQALGENVGWELALKSGMTFRDFVRSGGKTGKDTVLELFDSYCDSVKSSPTHKQVRDSLGDLGKVKLTDLRAPAVKRWRQSDSLLMCRGKSRSPSTLNRMVAVLRAALNYGVKEQMLMDTTWRTQLGRVQEGDTGRKVYLSVEQRKALVEHADEDAKPFIRLMLMLPLRPGDWAESTVSNFDRRTRTLFVSTKNKPRMVPLSTSAYNLLVEQSKDKLPGALLFPRADGSAWDKQSWGNAVDKAAGRAGLGDEVVLYNVRHSVITDLITRGTDLLQIAKVSGTSLAMISKYYGQLVQHVAVAALDDLAATYG